MSDVPAGAGAVFDPGRQPERTELAWRRTVMVIVVGALVSVRVLPAVLGGWALGAALLGLVTSGVVWALAARRCRRARAVLLGASGALPDGRVLLLVTALVVAGATLGVMYVVVR